MSSYYQRISRQQTESGQTSYYRCTELVQGAWNPHEQHMAAASGVLCAELEQFQPRAEMRIGRISFDILGLIPATDFEITTKVIRAGRTIELVEAQMSAQGKVCIVARVWRMMTQDSSAVMGLEDAVQKRPTHLPIQNILGDWDGKFIQTLKSQVEPSEHRAGKGMVWLNTDVEMVEGEATSDFVHLMGMLDTANGIVPRLPDLSWAFPNLDLQIHLLRMPRGRWLGLETQQQYGDDGIGLTSSVLHDDYGVFGRSEQILTLRQM